MTHTQTPLGLNAGCGLCGVRKGIWNFFGTPCTFVNLSEMYFIGPSGLRATSGLAEQLRETTIFGIFSHVGAAAGTSPAFTPEGIVVGF